MFNVAVRQLVHPSRLSDAIAAAVDPAKSAQQRNRSPRENYVRSLDGVVQRLLASWALLKERSTFERVLASMQAGLPY